MLELQTARSQVGLENDQVEGTQVLLTHNQALLLSRYLLKVTGQVIADEPHRVLWWRRWFR